MYKNHLMVIMEVLLEMDLNTVYIHPIKSSFMVYLPKTWVEHMELKKGDKLTWFLEENDFSILKLRKVD